MWKKTSISAAKTTLNGTTPVQLLGPNPKRVAIIFGASNSTSYTASPDPNVTNGAGMTMVTNVQPVVLDINTVGTCIQLPWWGVCGPVQTPTICVMEVVSQE